MTVTATAAPYTNGTIQDIDVNGLLHAGGYGTSQQPTTPQPQAQPPQSQPSALLAAATVLLSTLAGTSDHYEHVTLQDTIRSLYSRIKDDAEKQTFETLVYGAFKKGDEAKEFLESCQTSGGGNPFDNALTMSELRARPKKVWLMDGVISKGGQGMIFGGSGEGKTLVVVDMVGAMISGEPFAKRFDVPKPLNVGYCTEEGMDDLVNRFTSMQNARRINDETIDKQLFIWEATPQLHVDKVGARPNPSILHFIESYQRLQAEGKREPLDVLFIDTLHNATAGADENSASDMRSVMASCREASKALGCAVILVHHTGKNGEYRGSSSMKGDMNVMIQIKRIKKGETKAVMSCEKIKDRKGGEWESQTFDLVENGESVALWWGDPADEVAEGKQEHDRERIVKELEKSNGKWFEVKHLAAVIGKSDTHARNLLAKLVDDNRIVRRLKDESADPGNRNPFLYGDISMVNSSSQTIHKPVKN